MPTQEEKDVKQQVDIAIIKKDISILKDGQTKQDSKTDIILDRLDKFSFVKQSDFDEFKAFVINELDLVRPVGKFWKVVSSQVSKVIGFILVAGFLGYIATQIPNYVGLIK